MKYSPLLVDDIGRQLKEFKVGEWYTNPKHYISELPDTLYFRVGSVEICKGCGGYHYNSLVFDAVANENWEITEIRKTQSNTDYDQEMQLVEKVQPEFNLTFNKNKTKVVMNKKTVSIAAYEALKEQGMKIGSMVKILAAWPEKSEGFDAFWPEVMNATVGKIGKVANITVEQNEVRVSVSIPGSDSWWYPTMVLSLVESKSTLFEVNEKISLYNFDETAQTASITIKGDSNIREVTYASINALYKAIKPEPKKIKFAKEYEANINHTTRTVSIGCQSVSFEEIERVYKRINQIIDFSVGDTVEYYRQPTAAEWEKIGRVDIPFSIGQKLVIKRINKSTGSLEFEDSIYCYPKQAFKYA